MGSAAVRAHRGDAPERVTVRAACAARPGRTSRRAGSRDARRAPAADRLRTARLSARHHGDADAPRVHAKEVAREPLFAPRGGGGVRVAHAVRSAQRGRRRADGARALEPRGAPIAEPGGAGRAGREPRVAEAIGAVGTGRAVEGGRAGLVDGAGRDLVRRARAAATGQSGGAAVGDVALEGARSARSNSRGAAPLNGRAALGDRRGRFAERRRRTVRGARREEACDARRADRQRRAHAGVARGALAAAGARRALEIGEARHASRARRLAHARGRGEALRAHALAAERRRVVARFAELLGGCARVGRRAGARAEIARDAAERVVALDAAAARRDAERRCILRWAGSRCMWRSPCCTRPFEAGTSLPWACTPRTGSPARGGVARLTPAARRAQGDEHGGHRGPHSQTYSRPPGQAGTRVRPGSCRRPWGRTHPRHPCRILLQLRCVQKWNSTSR